MQCLTRKSFQRFALCLLFVMFFNVPAFSHSVNQILEQAKKGNLEAQFEIGCIYATGDGVKKNLAEAARWWKIAAERGEYKSQYLLAVAYYNGEGVKKNKSECLKWLRKSAAQGYDWAQFDLGTLYYQGDGVQQNVNEALKLWRLAAQQGNKDAKEALNAHKQAQELAALGMLGELFFGGSGGGNNSYNNSNTPKYDFRDGCLFCGGTGRCRDCEGKGRVYKANYNYNPETDPDSWQYYEDWCPTCGGSGKCKNCDGTGRT